MSTAAPLLTVEGLHTQVQGRAGPIPIVRDVSFTLARGEALGLIGESGSGKTMTGLSLLGLLPDHAAACATALRFDGHDLTAGEPVLAPLRGRRMAMIFQDPVGSFNPAKTIGWHLRRALARAGEATSGAGAALLADVGLPAPERVLAAYPHQLSGGMLQRALIAMVLALQPDLIVADEPTTNLDNVVERQILRLLRDLQERSGAALLFITHDLTLARDLCDRIAVLYAGEIVEIGPAAAVLERPRHPYTQGLLATVRSLDRGDPLLFEIPGEPGGAGPQLRACAFAGRCPRVQAACRAHHPALAAAGTAHQVRCVS